jgi:hypothetical protein
VSELSNPAAPLAYHTRTFKHQTITTVQSNLATKAWQLDPRASNCFLPVMTQQENQRTDSTAKQKYLVNQAFNYKAPERWPCLTPNSKAN